MIDKIITYYATQLENFLGNIFNQSESIVKIMNIKSEDNVDNMNKLAIALLSVEKDTHQGIPVNHTKNNSGGFSYGLPPLNINLNVVFAAVYDNKRYMDSLSTLSWTILFLQANPVITLSNSQKYTIEIVTLSPQELSNIWTYMGGHYYPSVICKIRKLVFNSGEIKGTSGQAGKPSIETGKKDS